VVPGGTRRNLASVAPLVDFGAGLDEVAQLIVADAQTSGGLLMAVAPTRADALLAELHTQGVAAAAAIGRFTDRGGRIDVV
jgi:selenide,water dikinase